MPVYVYKCADCGAEIERRQSFSDAPLTTCEGCSGPLRRLVFPAGVIFKGSGWYSTDSRAATNGKRDSADAKEKTGAEKTGTTESGAAAPAAESKSTTKDGGEKATAKKSEPAPASTKS